MSLQNFSLELEWRIYLSDVCKQASTFWRDFKSGSFCCWKLIWRLRLFVNNKSRLSRLNPSFVADFPLGLLFFFFVTVSHLLLCSAFLSKAFFCSLLWKEEKIVYVNNVKRDFIHRPPNSQMRTDEWMRKSCEIKLALFSHQKQQHVMMIIIRFCWISFFS